jgi:hypothetical protein
MFAAFKPKEGRRGTAVLKSGGGVMGPYMPSERLRLSVGNVLKALFC